MRRASVVIVLGLLALGGCKNKCEKLEAHMSDIGMGFSDAERERKKCNRGEYSDEYIECAMEVESRADLDGCGW